MGTLNAKERNKLKSSDFAIPGERKYPIQDEDHARAALSMVAKYGDDKEKAQVRAAVKKKYPGIQ